MRILQVHDHDFLVLFTKLLLKMAEKLPGISD